MLRGMNEADAAGIKRPGIILATRPGALVNAPTAATIRYVGPLLDYGNVMILEPQQTPYLSLLVWILPMVKWGRSSAKVRLWG